jgi:hypothetical protein
VRHRPRSISRRVAGLLLRQPGGTRVRSLRVPARLFSYVPGPPKAQDQPWC